MKHLSPPSTVHTSMPTVPFRTNSSASHPKDGTVEASSCSCPKASMDSSPSIPESLKSSASQSFSVQILEHPATSTVWRVFHPMAGVETMVELLSTAPSAHWTKRYMPTSSTDSATSCQPPSAHWILTLRSSDSMVARFLVMLQQLKQVPHSLDIPSLALAL